MRERTKGEEEEEERKRFKSTGAVKNSNEDRNQVALENQGDILREIQLSLSPS